MYANARKKILAFPETKDDRINHQMRVGPLGKPARWRDGGRAESERRARSAVAMIGELVARVPAIIMRRP
jgi:hypothetical protein